eukprot:COSAG01_NODE_521_length_15963_cov_76.378530_15_plen_147_part_00
MCRSRYELAQPANRRVLHRLQQEIDAHLPRREPPTTAEQLAPCKCVHTHTHDIPYSLTQTQTELDDPPSTVVPVLHDCKTACLSAGGRESVSAGGVIQAGLSLPRRWSSDHHHRARDVTPMRRYLECVLQESLRRHLVVPQVSSLA